jgi:DNA primase
MHGVSFVAAAQAMARDLGIGVSAQRSLAFRAAPDEEVPEAQTFEPLTPDRMSVVCDTFLRVCGCEDQTEGRNYLARRGIDAETMKRASVVYFPRQAYRRVMRSMLDRFALDELQQSGLFNAEAHLTFYRHRLLFPFYVEGRAMYLQARTTASGVEPRWHNMRGGVPSLYNVDALANLVSGEIVYLVEGFTDTLTLSAHGFAAVGLVGAGGFKEEWLAPLARFRVVAALDGDAAGKRAAHHYRRMFAERGAQLACLHLSSDVNDFFRQTPTAALEFALMTEAAIEGMKDYGKEAEARP